MEKHFLTRTLAELHKMDQQKIDVNLVTKLATFKDTLEQFFPDKSAWNIGIRCDEIDKNIFLNEFLYGILSNMYNFQD